MNIKDLHIDKKVISTAHLFKIVEGNVTSIQIAANGQLKEHITKVPALLLCVSGEVVFGNENAVSITLTPGDYYYIEPLIKHWIHAIADSNLILIK